MYNKATTRLLIKHLFTTQFSKFVGVSKDIEIQNKTYTIEHKKLCNVAILNFELCYPKKKKIINNIVKMSYRP